MRTPLSVSRPTGADEEESLEIGYFRNSREEKLHFPVGGISQEKKPNLAKKFN